MLLRIKCIKVHDNVTYLSSQEWLNHEYENSIEIVSIYYKINEKYKFETVVHTSRGNPIIISNRILNLFFKQKGKIKYKKL